MEKPDYPCEDQLLETFGPISGLFHAVLPVFVKSRVIPYFAQDGLPVDGTIASVMIRYAAKRAMKTRFPSPMGSDSARAPEALALNWLPNHGIECVFRGFAFKVLRARNGGMPVPGYSAHRHDFLNNRIGDFQIPLGGVFDEVAQRHQFPNIVILWDFDPTYEDLSLWLALPNRTNGPWEPVDCIYIVEAPPPAEATSVLPDDLAPIVTDDLPIENVAILDEADSQVIPVEENRNGV